MIFSCDTINPTKKIKETTVGKLRITKDDIQEQSLSKRAFGKGLKMAEGKDMQICRPDNIELP